MKTPEEIKKGLAEAPHIQYRTSTQNDGDGHSTRYAVAIGYVFRDEIVGWLQQLEANYQQVSRALCGKENATLDEVLQAVSQVKLELEAVKRERDAAMRHLHGNCDICKWYETENCAYCIHDPDAWNTSEDNWQWRGVCPENTEEEK